MFIEMYYPSQLHKISNAKGELIDIIKDQEKTIAT